jgi:DNA-binding response OmpR family regulator
LIVDDNREFGAAATELLTQQGLEVVAVASNGPDAVRLAVADRPDVVLLDLELGPESGFDVAADIAARAGVPVVLISAAYSASEVADLSERSPAVGFISKADLSSTAITDVLKRSRPSD